MSSKTIECASIHKDTINFTTKAGEQRSVVFEDKDGVGFAMIDAEDAEVLLGGIGRPEFWKPGTTGDAVEDALKNDTVAAATGAALLAGKKAVAELIEKVKAAATVEEVETVVGADTHKSVLKAAEERKAELSEKAE